METNSSVQTIQASNTVKRKNTGTSESGESVSQEYGRKRLRSGARVIAVWNDAEEIARTLDIADRVEEVYDYILDRGSLDYTVEIVVNELLMSNLKHLKKRCAERFPVEATGSGSSDNMDQLFSDVQKVVTIVREKKPSLSLDENQIFEMLQANPDQTNSVRDVVNILLSHNDLAAMPAVADENSADVGRLTEDANLVLKTFPNEDLVRVKSLLSDYSHHPDRVTMVLRKLNESNEIIDGQGNNSENIEDDPLIQDMKSVAAVFPNHDRNEIYAYLEAHHGSPNRVQIVMEELLRIQKENGTMPAIDLTQEEADNSGLALEQQTTAGSEPKNSDDFPLKAELEILMGIFPDCDPDYALDQLKEVEGRPDAVEMVTLQLFEKKYPKVCDTTETAKIRASRARLQNLNMEPEKFLEVFANPEEQFYDENHPVSESYKAHAVIQLNNDFDKLSATCIQQKFLEHKSHYALAFRSLTAEYQGFLSKDKSTALRAVKAQKKHNLLKKSRNHQPLPEVPDEYFYHEMYFVRNERRISEYRTEKMENRELQMARARIRGELQTCGCCYDNEVLFEDMLSCPDGHLFCRDCIRRSAEVSVGDSRTKFPCLTENCPTEFTIPVLQQVVSSKFLSLVLRKMQEEELRQADIPDLVSCPFCSFSTIMPNLDDKLFRCLNPECLKESCRLCKELNHIPQRCEEVEKSAETDMRVFIESRMTEAMLRTCWKCSRKFYKTEGCNKMTCVCGAMMCYVCRQPVKDYTHFDKGPCILHSDDSVLHRKEVENAAKEARNQYLSTHPEAGTLQLKNDPSKILPEVKKPGTTVS